MSTNPARREFIAGLCAGLATAAIGPIGAEGMAAAEQKSAFELSVITDEISQDFGHALEVAAGEFGLHHVEIRGLWKKNIVALDDNELGEATRVLKKRNLKVTDIASPLFKVDWPGAPASRYSKAGAQFGADYSYTQQDEVLERAAHAARALGTDQIRCFDFWRLENQAPYREAIDERLRQGAEKAAKLKVKLILENEYECNTGTGAEAARTMNAVKHRNLLLNWDPGNAAALGETAYPDGYEAIPKDRIGHMHCKDLTRNADGSWYFQCMGRGVIDYAGQFGALLHDGYRRAVSLETHWNKGGTPEECSRQSMAGMKALLHEAGAFG